MAVGEYLTGWLWVVVVAASHGWVATRLRVLLLPGVSGPGACLGIVVLFVLSVLTLGQVLGAVGWLGWWPVLLGSITLAIVAEVAARRLGGGVVAVAPTGDQPSPGTWWESRAEPVVAVACTAAVGWQWTTHLADAFDRGMVQADNLWYHGPFLARFLQTGGFGDLGNLGYSESRYYPMNSELLHAIMTMPFDRDLLVPLTNHVFAAMWVLAAFVIGRRRGVGALAVLASMVVASLPLVASTQPGQMYNDIMTGALILAAVALLVDGAASPGGLAVAGGSIGAAIGTKLSVATVIGPLAIVVLAVLLVRRRFAAALAWTAAATVTGGFWFARNWVVHGSPTPYFDIDLGPIHLPATGEREIGETLFATLHDLGSSGGYYLESIRISFGPMWPLLPIGSLVACAVVLIRPCGWQLRSAALAALAGVVTFPFLPVTGGLPFVNNLRYGVPALMLAMVLLAVAAAPWRWARVIVTAVSAAAVVGNLTSGHRGRVPAWPGHHEWGWLAAVAIAGGAWWWARRGRGAAAVASRERRAVYATVAVAGALALIGAWPLQRHYLANRYVGSGVPDDALYRPFHAISGMPVQALGTVEAYPLFGQDLSNDVTVWNEHIRMSATSLPGCTFWRTAMDAERGYIAVSTSTAWLQHEVTAELRADWFERDPSVEIVLNGGPMTVYFHDEPLNPSRC